MLPHLTAPMRANIESAIEAAWALPGPLKLDFSQTEAIDGVGAAMLAGLLKRARRANRDVHSVGLSPRLTAFLAAIPFSLATAKARATPEPPWLETLGGALFAAAVALLRAAAMAADLAYFSLDALRGRRRRVRGLEAAAVARSVEHMGAGAVPIVALIAGLVGLTIAMQSAVQLRPYGATLFVVDLIGLSVCRELGPLIAAIVVAGRSGAACAAEIATMVVGEEVAALEAMGIDPVAYTVLPKMLALIIALPMVALCAQAAAIAGAFGVARLTLDISASAFVARLAAVVSPHDLIAGVAKSMVFAALIVLVAARCGFAVVGGAEGVGHSTTRSVVLGIFCIVVADAAFSFVLYA